MIDIIFETARFNLSETRENRFGLDVLEWLGPKLELHGAHAGKQYPQAEGWKMEVSHGEITYLITVSGRRLENSVSQILGSWRITVTKRRSLLDRALGKNRMSKTDPLLWMIESALQAEGDITNVHREASAA